MVQLWSIKKLLHGTVPVINIFLDVLLNIFYLLAKNTQKDHFIAEMLFFIQTCLVELKQNSAVKNIKKLRTKNESLMTKLTLMSMKLMKNSQVV